jgi:ABC-type protease/lipase transport system fused ATPase/permease subunit
MLLTFTKKCMKSFCYGCKYVLLFYLIFLVVLINILFLLFPQYCRAMRDQILESFNHRDFSIMVVGNKYDLIAESNPHTQVGIHNISFFFINCL